MVCVIKLILKKLYILGSKIISTLDWISKASYHNCISYPCCVTHSPQAWWPKTTNIHYLTVSEDQNLGVASWWDCGSESLKRLQSRCCLGCSHLKAWLKQNLLPISFTWLFAGLKSVSKFTLVGVFTGLSYDIAASFS